MNADDKDRAARTEEALAAATRELAVYRSIADHSSDFILRYDHDLRITFVNQAVLQLTGSKAEEVVGLTHRERNLPEALCDRVESEVRAVFASGLPSSIEIETELFGEQIIVKLAHYPEFNEHGAVSAVLGISRNLTPTRLATSAARSAERKLRSMADTMPAYFAYVSIDDLVYRFVNRSFEVGFGIPREEIVGKHVREVIGEKNFAFALPYIEEVRKGRATHYENVFTLETGPSIARVNYAPDVDENGNVVGIVVLTYDVTEQHQIQRAIEESEARFRLLSEASPVGVFQTDPTGKLVFVNRRWEEITGRSIDASWMDGAHPDDHEQIGTAWRKSLQREVAFKGEFRCLHPGGEVRWVMARTAPHRRETGEVLGYVGVIEDVTDVKAQEAQQLRSQKLESVGILAGGIAHDFNNLLTTMLGTIGLARMDVPSGTKLDELLEESENACDRAVKLTTQLLTFARGGEPIRRVVRLAPIVEESVRFALRGSAVAYKLDFAEDLWFADVDEGQLGQLLHNLVLNASQAMASCGTIWISVLNTTEDSDGNELCFVKITVRDEGAGIPADQLPKIFDPYFTTKHAGQGLGLAMCHSIAARHGGRIQVSSEVGVGTAFEVLLPRAQRPLEEEAEHEDEGASQGRGRVLVMDDEETVRTTAQRILARLGYDVELAEDGSVAVEVFRQARDEHRTFDLVILDLTVPGGVGGLACLESLRQIDPKVRAVVSSGYSNDPVLSDPKRYGFAGALPKPFRVAAMAMVIARVLT